MGAAATGAGCACEPCRGEARVGELPDKPEILEVGLLQAVEGREEEVCAAYAAPAPIADQTGEARAQAVVNESLDQTDILEGVTDPRLRVDLAHLGNVLVRKTREEVGAVLAAPAPVADETGKGGRIFSLTVTKQSASDKMLGMKVRPLSGGMIEVVNIDSIGIVHQHNTLAQTQDSGVEQLLVKDIIFRVNEVEGDDLQLVAECMTKATLVMQVARNLKAGAIAAAAKADAKGPRVTSRRISI